MPEPSASDSVRSSLRASAPDRPSAPQPRRGESELRFTGTVATSSQARWFSYRLVRPRTPKRRSPTPVLLSSPQLVWPSPRPPSSV
ncbi:MAG: hypothetical protein ACT4PK_01405 [Gammaproteobacteria bacterium]